MPCTIDERIANFNKEIDEFRKLADAYEIMKDRLPHDESKRVLACLRGMYRNLDNEREEIYAIIESQRAGSLH